MKYEQNLLPRLVTLGAYNSPIGGSRNPAMIAQRRLLFEVIQEGSVYGLEDEPVLHGEGSVFCHRPGQQTVSDSPPQSYYSCMVASFEYDAKTPPINWPRCFYWKDRQSMHRFTEEMLYAFHHAAMDRTVIGNLIWSRLHFELEQFRTLEKMQHVHPQLRVATDFINSGYHSALSLEDVAQAAGVSVSHLHMLFRDHLGESPHQYLIQKRMRVAGHSLATNDQPIKAIAAEVGYANTESFCRAFRKFFGRSASEYRQAYSRASQLS